MADPGTMKSNIIQGCAMTRVIRRPVTMVARVCARVSPCGICGGQSPTETNIFSLSCFVFTYQYHYTFHPKYYFGDEQKVCWPQSHEQQLPYS
jgi:hypothetical protein